MVMQEEDSSMLKQWPRCSKSVSFAATVNFDLELKPNRSSDRKEMMWELFLLLLLVALALLAPAGQAIAHVNDIILLYVGYSVVTFMFQSSYSPLSKFVSRSRTCSRRGGRRSRSQSTALLADARRFSASSRAFHVMDAE
jgi:hypothetical protein